VSHGLNRLVAVLTGVLLMLGSAVVAGVVCWLLFSAAPELAGEGRLFMVLPFAPLTAFLVFMSSTRLTRRLRPSSTDMATALLIVELMLLGLIARISGRLVMDITFLFWATLSLLFAPCWILGYLNGRRTLRR